MTGGRWAPGLLLAVLASCVVPDAPSPSVAGTVVWGKADRQAIDGFGGSNAWKGLPSDPAAADKVVKLLFSPTEGIGLSLIRNRIPFRESTTYDDQFLAKDGTGRYTSTNTPAGHRSFQLNWTTWDLANTKALFAKARAYSPDLRGFSTPWTPPNNQYDLWKVSGTNNTVGGALGTAATWPDIGGELDPAHYQDYADVLADYAQQFESHMGYPLAAVSIQNEPNWLPKTYESCWWSAAQFQAFLPFLSSAWAAKGVTTPVIAPEGAQFAEDLIAPSLGQPAGALVSIVGVHQYDADASSGKLAASWLPATKAAGKKLWMTEVSASGTSASTSIDDGLWCAQLVHADLTTAEVNAFCFWWFWDTPGSKGSLLGVSGSSVTDTKRLYALGQYSRFVRPGWVRVSATNSPADGVLATVFRDPQSARFAVVLVNTSPTATTVSVEGGPAIAAAALFRTSATENLASLGAIEPAGSRLTVTLAARSVSTVSGTLVP